MKKRRFSKIGVMVAVAIAVLGANCAATASEVAKKHHNGMSAGKTREIAVVAFAYTSSTDDCDADPFTNASGTRPRQGSIAANWLPFGTKMTIEGFSNRVFRVDDRMASRWNGKKVIDIWMPDKADALKFGRKNIKIFLVEE